MFRPKIFFSFAIFFLYTFSALVFLPYSSSNKIQAKEREPEVVNIDIDLPSSSTGSSTGTLAVRIFAPSNLSEARYAEGAPVMVFATGGESAGTLSSQIGRAEDVIRIVFLYPGGRDTSSGRQSGGTYDYRGANSNLAVRDVILYAAGVLRDNQNRTIDQVVPVPVLHNNIGIFGSSNGGGDGGCRTTWS